MIILPVPTRYGLQLINISTLPVLFIFFFIISASVHFTVVQQGTVWRIMLKLGLKESEGGLLKAVVNFFFSIRKNVELMCFSSTFSELDVLNYVLTSLFLARKSWIPCAHARVLCSPRH